jgi:hypothetical protein
MENNGNLAGHLESGEAGLHKRVVYRAEATVATDNEQRTTDVLDSPFTIRNS